MYNEFYNIRAYWIRKKYVLNKNEWILLKLSSRTIKNCRRLWSRRFFPHSYNFLKNRISFKEETMNKELLEKIQKSEFISNKDTIFTEINEVVENTLRLTSELNTGYKTPEEVRNILTNITGKEIDSSVQVLTPFNTDFGVNIRLGKDIFINKSCMFVDLGGIELEDNVLIGPDVKILSVNHSLDPKNRRGVILRSVKIKRNVWLGAGVTVCPGVTIGENSVVGAGSVVTKDVPDNTVYAGVPAKFIKNI